MSLVEKVKTICIEQMDELASTIEGELKAECPKRTGRAAASIHIEELGEYRRRIGAKANFSDYSDGGVHLYYADQGNGGSGKTIKSTRPTDRLGRKPGKLHIMNGMHTMYVSSVSGYEGTHFIKAVADRHR